MRFLTSVCILLLVFTLSRALVRFLPGDPITTLLAETGSNLTAEALSHELGLDRPFFPALVQDLKKAVHLDLGRSLISREPIAPVLWRRFKNTLTLAAIAFALTAVASLTLGLLAAEPSLGVVARVADRTCTLLGAITSALPTPWIGPIFAYLFAFYWPIFPLGNHWALPALVLALNLTGLWSRLIRERVREVLLYGAARAARARGLSEGRVLIKYGLVPAAGALVAFLGTQFGALLTGAFITEIIFDWPGMGSFFIDAVLKRDYPTLEACVLFGATASLAGTWAGDFARWMIDPRGREVKGTT